jgi:hypothetical protein
VTPITCGIVLARAASSPWSYEPGEARRAIRLALTDDARCGLVEYLAAVGADVVLTEGLVRGDAVARRALDAGLTVWAALDALVAAVAAPPRSPTRHGLRRCSAGCPASRPCALSSGGSSAPSSRDRSHSCDRSPSRPSAQPAHGRGGHRPGCPHLHQRA